MRLLRQYGTLWMIALGRDGWRPMWPVRFLLMTIHAAVIMALWSIALLLYALR